MPLAVPRTDRAASSPRLVAKGEWRLDGLDDMIISLYSGGMTARDIQARLGRTVGTELSHHTISKITDAVLDEVKAWKSRPPEEIYPIVDVDAVVVKVRDGAQVRNKAAHLADGVDLDGVKHVRGIQVQANEGGKFCAGVCAELANRGVRAVLIACCDGPTRATRGARGDRGDVPPRHRADLCSAPDSGVDALRVLPDREKIAAALRPVYTAPTADAAQTALLTSADSELGKRNPAVTGRTPGSG